VVRTLVLAAIASGATACAAQPVATTPATTPPVTTTTSPAVSTSPSPSIAAAVASPCEPGVAACVRLSTRQAWLGGDAPIPISPGGPGFETPTGTFAVEWKAESIVSDDYGTPMPHAVFFAPGGIAFHEGSLIEPSHGCVHLTPDTAARFFGALGIGASVQVVP
jgi:hypothetical protein